MDDADLGTLTRQGDQWTLTFTRRLAHPREKVWRAVTEPEHLAVWYPQEIVGERKAGAALGRALARGSPALRHPPRPRRRDHRPAPRLGRGHRRVAALAGAPYGTRS